MKKFALLLGVALVVFGCNGGDGDGGTGGTGGGGVAVGPAAPLALECALLGNEATFPYEFGVTLAGEPVIGQPVDATVSVSLVFPVDLVCAIVAAAFTSTDIQSASNTVTITGVSAPDPGEVTVTLPNTPITDIVFADACDSGNGPGLEFNFDPQTVSVTPNGASTMDFLLTVDGVDLNLANLVGPFPIPALNVPVACATAFTGADPDEDDEFNNLATPELQIQITVLCNGVDCSDDNECTADACVEGACSSTNVEDGTPCNAGAGLCQAGACVDRCDGVTCEDDGNECTNDICNPLAWLRQTPMSIDLCDTRNVEGRAVPDGTLCDNGNGMCLSGVCTDACTGVNCGDGNECTQDLCDLETGECSNPNEPDQTDCDFGGNPGKCLSGVCEGLCFDAGTRCDDNNDCTAGDCDPANGNCSNTNLTGTVCDFAGNPGICADGVCGDAGLCADAATRCDDANECTDNLCNPPDGVCSNPAVADGTLCADGTGTCQGGACEGTLLTCGDPLNAVVEPCLSPFVLADDCFIVTGSVPVPTTPIVTPTAPLVDGTSAGLFPQIQASLPWPLLCLLSGPAGGGASLNDSALLYEQLGGGDFVTHSYVNPSSVFDPNVETPHGGVFLDFDAACTAEQDININLFGNADAGICEFAGVPLLAETSSCLGGAFDGTSPCAGAPDCYGPATLDLLNLPGTLSATQTLGIVPTGSVETFGFTHQDIAIDLGDVIPGVLEKICLGGACPIYGAPDLQVVPAFGTIITPAVDGCPARDRDGDGVGGGADDSPRIMYDANCTTADVLGMTGCTPFITGDDAFEVLACDLGTDTTNPNWGQSCTVATAEADCGTGVACTLQTLGSLFTESGFAVLTDCCNNTGDADGTPGQPVGCGPAGSTNPPRSAACAGILALYPTASEAQWVQVPVNPAP